MVLFYRVKCSSVWDRSPQLFAVKNTFATPLTKGGRGDPLRAFDQYRNRSTQVLSAGELA